MPTFETTVRFDRDFGLLDEAQKKKFRKALKEFIADLSERRGVFRASLRVKHVQGTQGIYEMTWDKESDIGRATFLYGPSQVKNEPHVIWRRCGSHRIFKLP